MHYRAAYPAAADARDRFVLALRTPRARPDAWRYQALIVEDERAADGRAARAATILLTGRECPWRCVMCDLWRGTTADDTPPGSIPAQIAAARDELARRGERVSHVKLYNAGSFFDPRAVPESDYAAIARELAGLEHAVVESHPALVGRRLDRLLDALAGQTGAPTTLEVAMGLETAHPAALEALNKRMTVDDFRNAAAFLRARRVALRVFLLVSPPGVPDHEQDDWLLRSVMTAFDCGAGVVSLVPARPGNGAMEALSAAGAFRRPALEDIERSFDLALSGTLGPGPRASSPGARAPRLFLDVWDLERFAACGPCLSSRRARLHRMNLEQRVLPRVACDECRAV